MEGNSGNSVTAKARHLNYKASRQSAGERLDVFLSTESFLSRSHIQKLIKRSLITVNNAVERPSYTVREGDEVHVEIPDEPEDILVPEPLSLNIVYEDEDIIVINKPPGIVVHPATGNKSGTIMNALAYHTKKLSSIGAPLRPGVVHRLDKDTSGLMVVAKDNRAYYFLAEQFRDRTVQKQYVALIFGVIRDDTGEINKLIGRSSADRKKMTTRTRSGKEAVTQYNVIERLNQATLVRIRILTGRTHQIRVHFASIGHPVLGDHTYGRRKSIQTAGETVRIQRQMLHASFLKIKHPGTRDYMEFEAPLPEDMNEVIAKLKIPQ